MVESEEGVRMMPVRTGSEPAEDKAGVGLMLRGPLWRK